MLGALNPDAMGASQQAEVLCWFTLHGDPLAMQMCSSAGVGSLHVYCVPRNGNRLEPLEMTSCGYAVLEP